MEKERKSLLSSTMKKRYEKKRYCFVLFLLCFCAYFSPHRPDRLWHTHTRLQYLSRVVIGSIIIQSPSPPSRIVRVWTTFLPIWQVRKRKTHTHTYIKHSIGPEVPNFWHRTSFVCLFVCACFGLLTYLVNSEERETCGVPGLPDEKEEESLEE
ncbi:hypothetical protein F4778DRAFT_95134 [Xylariomycetidae sp. FL2044]|nr:hypothetical protein F4778DRAFT_95134 [Xylariomycetidae sp. FL2044]